MKDSDNLKIVLIISFLLVFLSVSISLINFTISLESKEKELKNRSLPLTVDNIYTEIQSNIIEPNLVSSMMASDTFVKDWLVNEEDNHQKIQRFLDTIKNKYSMFVTFLVSENSQNYYTHEGFLEKVSEGNENNQWYFRFKNLQEHHEINLDFNEHMGNSMIMFINHKIFDRDFHLLGMTGIGIKVSYIDEMLKHFRQKYKFSVMFIDANGQVRLAERQHNQLRKLDDIAELAKLKDEILVKDSKILEYEVDGESYLLNTKYIPELDMHLVVQAKLLDFIGDVRQTFYFNLIGSLLITLLVTGLILLTVKKYNRKIKEVALQDDLTGLKNRRAFNDEVEQFILLAKRHQKPLSFIFFDVDDFKIINDSLGHQKGDEILRALAETMQRLFRSTDLVARWGGEEFIIGLINTRQADAALLAEKLRLSIESDVRLTAYLSKPVTISVGVSSLGENDSLDSVFHRLDEAMYQAKQSGKNQVISQ